MSKTNRTRAFSALTTRITLSDLQTIAASCGLELVGVLPYEEAKQVLTEHATYLAAWQGKGFAGSMSYMMRDPRLFCEPRRFFDSVTSIICLAVRYDPRPLPARPAGCGRVARYAWGKDYHLVLKERSAEFVELVRKAKGVSSRFRIFSDAVPLLERALATGAGLGFLGKNTMLIRPGVGSFTFLAEILWDLAVEDDSRAEDRYVPRVGNPCKSCVRCLVSCPTGALVSGGVLDSSRCISYLTIEKRGEFEPGERAAVGEWVFGCDICQDVCPFNYHGLDQSTMREFWSESGSGPYLDLLSVLNLRSVTEFSRRFAQTPFKRAGRVGLLRNACAVIGNTGYLPAISYLSSTLFEDSSPLVRIEAKVALERLFEVAEGHDRREIRSAISKLRSAPNSIEERRKL